MTAPSAEIPIASAGEAELAVANLNNIMDRLEATVVEETARLRAGRLNAARELDATKSELARLYATQSERVKAARGLIAKSQPQAIEALRTRHAAFQSVLQTNMTVLATAHAVSEGIIRGVNSEIRKKSMPQTYTATGYRAMPNPRHASPLSVSRTL